VFLIILRINNDFYLDDISRFVFIGDTMTVYFLLPGYDAMYSVPYHAYQTSRCYCKSPCDLKNSIPTLAQLSTVKSLQVF